LQKAIAIAPGLVSAHYYLGASLYRSQANAQEALTQWQEALRLQPDFVLAMDAAAHALAASPDASVRNGTAAVKLAQQAVQLSHAGNPAYLDTLAEAYAEAGRFPEAITAAHQALDLATRQHLERLMEGLDTRIKLYEAQQPYRDTLEIEQ